MGVYGKLRARAIIQRAQRTHVVPALFALDDLDQYNIRYFVVKRTSNFGDHDKLQGTAVDTLVLMLQPFLFKGA
jgi:hypothetical protein